MVAPRTAFYALGVLRVITGAETGAELRMSLLQLDVSVSDAALWAALFDTFAHGRPSSATGRFLQARSGEVETALRRVF